MAVLSTSKPIPGTSRFSSTAQTTYTNRLILAVCEAKGDLWASEVPLASLYPFPRMGPISAKDTFSRMQED